MAEPPQGSVAVMALGEDRYGLIRPFWSAGESSSSGVTDVAVAADGTVLVLRRSDPPIVRVALDGAVLGHLGGGLILDGHALTVAPDGLIWVVDRDAHEVLALDPRGTVVRRLGERHHPVQDGGLNHPAAVAVAPDGRVLVADGYGNNMVHVFDVDGRPVHRFGGRGSGRGHFSTPHGILIDCDGRVLVADREHDRVQVLDLEGRFLAEWSELHRPMALAMASDGSILVSDQVPRLSRFREDRFVGACRPVATAGHGLAVGPDGSIYLAETPPFDRVVRLEPIMALR